MKKYITVTLTALLLSVAGLDAKPTQTAILKNGIPVYTLPAAETGIFTLAVVIRGGHASVNTRQAGIEQLALRMLQYGSSLISRDKLEQLQDSFQFKTGSLVFSDYSIYYIKCLRSKLRESLLPFLQTTVQPLIPAKSLEREKKLMLDSLLYRRSQPFRFLAHKLQLSYLQGHPYLAKAAVSPVTVQGISVNDIKSHLRKMFAPDRITVIMTRSNRNKAVGQLLDSVLGKLSGTSGKKFTVGPLQLQNRLQRFNRPRTPITYAAGIIQAPPLSHPDYLPFVIAADMLSDLLQSEIRTRNSLVYSVWATPPSRDKAPRANIGVYRCRDLKKTARLTKKALQLLKQGICELRYQDENGNTFTDPAKQRPENLKKIPVRAKLQDYINKTITGTFMEQQSGLQRIIAAATARMVSGDWPDRKRYFKMLKSVTADDIIRTAKRWFKDFHWGVTGDKAVIQPLTVEIFPR